MIFLQKHIQLDIYVYINVPDAVRGRRDRMLVGFTVPINTNVVSSNPIHGEIYPIQHFVIKFVSYLRQVVFSGYSGSIHQ